MGTPDGPDMRARITTCRQRMSAVRSRSNHVCDCQIARPCAGDDPHGLLTFNPVALKANRETPDRVPEAYTAFYRTALVRLDELELEKANALESVQDIATELKGVHEAILALYFDPARTTGTGGKTAPMALN